MAPRKRKAAPEGGEVTESVTAAVAEAKKESGVGRVTRSSSRLVSNGSAKEPAAIVNEKVQKKPAVKEKVVNKAKVVEKKEEEEVVEKKEEEVNEKEVKEEDKDKEEEVVDGKNGAKATTIVIEHCKQCNAFKTRAMLVKERLENAIDGIQVLVNPEKPRRGCFEIREQGGETFLTLLDMKRPFPPLKALDMEKVISDIIEKVK